MTHWEPVDGSGLSASDLARLKRIAKARRASAFQAALAQWRRPSRSLPEHVRDVGLTFWSEASRVQRNLPNLLAGEFLFALGQWVAVFAVAAAIVSTPQVPLRYRYAVGLAALAYLYLYAELARIERPLPGRGLLLATADATVAITIYVLSAPYVSYGNVLLFFAAARMVGRFGDLRAVPAGLLVLIPFAVIHQGPIIGLVLEAFGLLVLMLGIQHLFEVTTTARREAGRQAALATLSSAVARALDTDGLMGQLGALAPALLPRAAWAFWLRDAATGDFRPERWYGLPAGTRPVAAFTPSLQAVSPEAVEIIGPMPGTEAGERTLIQPMVMEGEVVGLITVSSGGDSWDPGLKRVLRPIAEECALALSRLHALGDERQRTEAMEKANRLAGLAAAEAHDQASALGVLLPALGEELRCDSVHLEWQDGDDLRLVISARDPLFLSAPPRMPLARTRCADALDGHVLVEPVAGRRPEDMLLAAAGVRHVAVAPLQSAAIRGTLQIGRREPRPFTASEVTLLQLLADRLALVFEAGLVQSARNAAAAGGQA